MKKFAVVLSGCGVFDGAEIHERLIETGNVFASPRAERIEVYPPALKAKLTTEDRPEAADMLLFMGCVPSFFRTTQPFWR